MTLLPTSTAVARAWLTRAVPGVAVGTALPEADAATRTAGFIRVQVVGGGPGGDVPWRAPVIGAECWIAPENGRASWARAEQLAARVLAATFDPAHQGVVLTLPGDYAAPRVHTVLALTEPTHVADPGDWSRFDLDLLVHWTGA